MTCKLRGMNLRPPTCDPAVVALFLDVDGTLLNIQERPEAVISSDSLSTLLLGANVRLGGAMALISGRTIAEIDRIFAPHQFTAAGAHGVEYRVPGGQVQYHSESRVSGEVIDELQSRLAELPGTFLELKNHGFAVHFRENPAAGPDVLAALEHARSQLGGAFHTLSGKMVHELVPDGYDKGQAIMHLMEEAPFAGRQPVFIGDDVTDEAGFAAVNALGGQSIRVGDVADSEATRALADVGAVHQWLQGLIQV